VTPGGSKSHARPTEFAPDESFARQLDAEDPLQAYRNRFHLPARADGGPVGYFCGNSLGLQPKAARAMVEAELEAWARLGVDGHFKADAPWYSYHALLRESAARLVGALPDEVVMMNGLTVNLHLMLVTFYRPTRNRHKVLIEAGAFPSDAYAIASQVRYHGYDPDESVLTARPRDGEALIRTDDIEAILETQGGGIALVMLSGVHYLTGQAFEIERIAAAARRRGCVVGFDLAHAVGNVPLRLHDWPVDFAVWCSYKYLNGGPGAVAGCFVHERHGRSRDAPRFAGWWGNDPETRFEMHRQTTFVPRDGADGWQLSNPPIFALAPLRASLAIFDEAGMDALRSKSVCLTAYLEYLIDRLSPTPAGAFEIITPRAPAARGCQLSIRVRQRPKELLEALAAEGFVTDFRGPDVIRVAPVPLYNTFHEVWRFAQVLAGIQGTSSAG
jgi:kynureninase